MTTFNSFRYVLIFYRIERVFFTNSMPHFFNAFYQGMVDLGSQWSEDTLSGNNTIEDLLNSNTTRHTNQLGHGNIVPWITVLDQA